MTKNRLERIVTDWQYRLGLERWVITIQWDVRPENDGALAEVKPHDTYDRAALRFWPDYPQWSEEWAAKIVVHELLHILHRDIDRAVDAAISDLPAGAFGQADARYEAALETFIDRIALRIHEIAHD